MKTTISATRRKWLMALLILLISLAKVNYTNAQPPDCVSGTVAYAVFNDSISSSFSSTLDSTEIRSVNLLTGAVGALVGGKRYWVRKYSSGVVGNNSSYIYGSSALAVDFVSNRFYVMTQMSNSLPKDIITIDPVAGTQTVIGTTPPALDGYHFVKMTSHPVNGWIYAIGVHRDSTTAASLVNPVIRFPVCGTAGCATANIQILGYLPSTGVMYKWLLFNGDIAFDNVGNLYFATAAFERIGGNGRYSDARLFRINAANLPTAVGAGTIPMTLVADYDALDSTVINGVGFNGSGSMFMTTRKYSGPQNTPLPPFSSQLYRSISPGNVVVLPAFAPPTAGTSVSDLATCYYPAAILSDHNISLGGQFVSGIYNIKWDIVFNPDIQYFQVQKSSDGINFEEAGRIEIINNGNQKQKYFTTDNGLTNASMVFYRIVEVTNMGARIYSNIIRLNGSKISIVKKITPNPFTNEISLLVQLRNVSEVNICLRDQNGRKVYDQKYNGNPGENRFRITALSFLKKGVYFLEISSGDEIIREKLIRQ